MTGVLRQRSFWIDLATLASWLCFLLWFAIWVEAINARNLLGIFFFGLFCIVGMGVAIILPRLRYPELEPKPIVQPSLPAGQWERYYGPCVYLIQDISETRYFKIGYTRNLQQRMKGLRAGSPVQLQLVHMVPCVRVTPENIEAYFHQMFAEQRRHGEWFELDDNDVSRMKNHTGF